MALQAASVQANAPADELRGVWNSPDPWSYDPKELHELQLAALRDRFLDRRQQLSVLDQRARDEKIDRIGNLQDAVPLLFSHTTYKSYPPSFLAKKRWDMMTRWLGTLSTHGTANTDLSNIADIDDWVRALHAAGHHVISSSGTTGHTSFVNQSDLDCALHRQCIIKTGEVIADMPGTATLPFFRGGPRFGYNMGGEQTRLIQNIYVRDGEDYYISDEGITIKELDRLASIRKAIVDGTATPGMIADAEKESSDRTAEMEGYIQRWLDRLFDHWGQPMYLFAGAATLWRIVESGRQRGIPDGAFNRNSVIRTGGGYKGFRGPANFYEDAERFFGIPRKRWIHIYGMTELSTQFLQCAQGRFHVPPTIILMLLDKAGEQVINQPTGVVEGRGGFFDTGLDGRWGGVISGDRLTVDFDPCPCGRKSATIKAVTRYQDLPEGDDKLTCAGQIDTYVRGLTGGDWQE